MLEIAHVRSSLGGLVGLVVATLLPLLSYAGNGVGVADLATTTQNVAIQIPVAMNDLGFGNQVTVAVTTPPANGTAVISGSPGSAGAVLATYTPAAGFSGTASFAYSVTDGESNSTATVAVTVLADGDLDGVANVMDNCTLLSNPTQCDSDGDGYGNRCDGDLNNIGGTTNAFDTPLFRAQLGQPSVGPTYNKADLNCNGSVNAFDTAIFRGLLGLPPGPSALRTGGNYTIDGTVSGLTGSGLTLQYNGGNNLGVSANGPFTFATGLASGAYSVTVLTQPSSPSQTCAVTPPSGTGTVGVGPAPNVLVTCTTNSFPLSLNVSGRIQSTDPLWLQSNSSAASEELIAVSGNSANITFPTPLVSGSSFTVTVAIQPKNFDQTCVIPAGGGTGTLGTTVAITVSCTTNGKFYYAVNTATSTISIYSLSSTTGTLSPVGAPIPTSKSPTWVEADGTGRFAYVVSKGLNPTTTPGVVSFYTINPDTGALTLGKTIATGRDPRHITLDRTNTYAWVPNYVDDTISSFLISSTGTPTAASPPVPTGDGPEDIDILTAQDAAGALVNAYAYVTVSGGNIWTYTINPGGMLTAVTEGIIYSGTGTPPILVIP